MHSDSDRFRTAQALERGRKSIQPALMWERREAQQWSDEYYNVEAHRYVFGAHTWCLYLTERSPLTCATGKITERGSTKLNVEHIEVIVQRCAAREVPAPMSIGRLASKGECNHRTPPTSQLTKYLKQLRRKSTSTYPKKKRRMRRAHTSGATWGR